VDPRDFEYYARLAREAEKYRPPPEVVEGLRHRAEIVKALADDPAIWTAYENAARIAAERRDWARNMPDAATRKVISEAARFFDSDYFRSQSAALVRAVGLARTRLGPEGLATAGRVAGRRASESPGAGQAAARIEGGEAETLLEEAAELATSPEVRELIERADVEALVRLDEQQAAEAEAGDFEPRAAEADRLAELWDRRPNKRQLRNLLDGGLLVLIPLEAALAAAAQLNPSSDLAVQLAVAILVLTAVLTWARFILSLMGEEDD
jgi:hypothetical protein